MRDFSEKNVSNFRTHLLGVSWVAFLNNDANESYGKFISEYSRLYNVFFPLKTIKLRKSKTAYSPWITKALLKSIWKKNQLYKRLLKKQGPLLDTKYRSYRNKLNHIIKAAKRTYYDRRFAALKNNMKETWQLINQVINRCKRKSSYPSAFNSDGDTITDPLLVANSFCHFFSNVGPNLAIKITSHDLAFTNFLPDHVNESIVLNPTDVTEVQEIGRSLKSGNSMGYDNICALILKISIDVISSPLVEIINLSLSQGVFPDKLKIAKLIPVFNAGESKYFTNYRPISLLSNFSKIFERVMHNRILEFVHCMEILYSCHFGFRKGFSTALSLIHLVNSFASAVDRNEFTVGVFLNLSKAFDTLDHRILLAKLEHYGFRGLALEWIKSYLSNRSQYVLFNGICSDPCLIKCGVPQGLLKFAILNCWCLLHITATTNKMPS